MKIIPLYVYDYNNEIIYSPNQLPGLEKLRDAYRLIADEGYLVTDGKMVAECLDVDDIKTRGEIAKEEE